MYKSKIRNRMAICGKKQTKYMIDNNDERQCWKIKKLENWLFGNIAF